MNSFVNDLLLKNTFGMEPLSLGGYTVPVRFRLHIQHSQRHSTRYSLSNVDTLGFSPTSFKNSL